MDPAAEPLELPRGFLQSLRTLFDILDDERRGSVHVLEIESRWRRGGQALPPGVLQCLRRAAPASGYLTFERLVAGLRTALLSPGRHPRSGDSGERRRNEERGVGEQACLATQIRMIAGLCPLPDTCDGLKERPRPPLGVRSTNIPEEPGRQRALVGDKEHCAERREVRPATCWDVSQPQVVEERRHLKTDKKPMARCQSEAPCNRTTYSRRQGQGCSEPRRQTITSGADYSMLKWMKELEQEKDALLQGLEMIECARVWYLHHLQAVQDHQRKIGQSSVSTGEAATIDSRRLHQMLPKLQLVSRCLADLTSSTAKPLVRTTNAVTDSDLPIRPSTPGLRNNAQVVSMLKEQNRQLTREVTSKSGRITQLEEEKSALIKQLFTARSQSQQESSQLDSTFI